MSEKIHGHLAGIEAAKDNLDKPEKAGLFDVCEIDPLRWNKQYPYQLIVVQKMADKTYKRVETFTLPFPPQTLDIDMPFAISTSATLGGVVEEHNGAPFRMISFAGTTGVLPLRGTPGSVPEFSLAGGLFAGTINAVNNLVANVNTGNQNFVANVVDDSDPAIATSGYRQYHLLKTFLERYASDKTKKARKNLMLALAIWKDRSTFLVTPISFHLRRSVDKPMEYQYALQFKAFARINLDAGPKVTENHTVTSKNVSTIQALVREIQVARQALEDAKKVIGSVRADAQYALLTPLREIALSLKAASGVAVSLADLPFGIIRDCKEAVAEFAGIETTLDAGYQNLQRTNQKNVKEIYQVSSLAKVANKTEALSSRTASTSSALLGSEPANKIFDNPEEHYPLFSSIQLSQLRLNPAIQTAIQTETNRTLALTRSDFETRRDSVLAVMVDFANAVGLGSATFSATKNQNLPAPKRVATDADAAILFTLNNVIMQLNKLCVSYQINPDTVSALDYIAGLATQSGIAFQQPISKYLAPFPYGHTLEQTAALYLGDANRWHELAALNGLQSPFVDEVGFDLTITSNPTNNTVFVNDSTNLFVGQAVWVSSAIVPAERRRITGITQIDLENYLVTLSGDPDLSKFTTSANAKLHAYLPNTVNSQMSLYLPSDTQADFDFKTKQIQGVDYFDSLIKTGGISLLLNSNNDIAFANGRTQLATGLTNIVQKTRIALSTVRGSVLQHPGYGLPLQVGASTADVDAKAVLRSIQEMFSTDPSFAGITGAAVYKQGPTTKVTVNVNLAGTEQNVPISAEIRR